MRVSRQGAARAEVDEAGLGALDHRYLSCIAKNYEGGPVGIETLAAALLGPAMRSKKSSSLIFCSRVSLEARHAGAC